ncbi:Uncharacterized protein BM_BM16919 [Brugia malayi]|uniref:Bm16919 n=1 Tax=Brugia malayi TaxID=6279 RepID=A0A0K0J2K0_BRUMA|nr:Uncharacterized protein BM_BM16919 [Brugia malayi]CRZ24114.1 Bm16919 [Brugia malayi]VIO94955.1 Uncharacterized protein BM_BM16919 [Brugia malayi]
MKGNNCIISLWLIFATIDSDFQIYHSFLLRQAA